MSMQANFVSLLERLRAISRAIAGQLDYELVLKNFAQEMQHILAHDHLDIVLLHRDGMQICYEAGIPTSWSSQTKILKPTAASPLRDILLERVPHIITDDAQKDRRFLFFEADNGPIFDANLRSRIIVPLTIQSRVIGSLAISSHDVGRYCIDMIDRVQAAADLLAPYLFALEEGRRAREAAVAEAEALGREEALRVGFQRLTEGIERERQRLGMDIHDQTLADLAGLVRRLNRVRRKTLPDFGELSQIEIDLGCALDDLRAIVEDMKPGVLQLFGFADAVEAHLDRSLGVRQADVGGSVQDRSDGAVDDFSDSARLALFRIVQEAINNAVRHAEAANINVEIDCPEGKINIRIEDDGSGFDEISTSGTGGIGNMRTRAKLISADLNIGRGNGCGTVVEIAVPWAHAENEA